MNPHNKGKGRALQWIREHVDYAGDDCLPWPMSLDGRGYGSLSVNGRLCKAPRVMCEMAHGPAPSPDHEAAHSCGNGHEGCTNPNHLSWKTRTANQQDRSQHGTAGRNEAGCYARSKLSQEDVDSIRSLIGTDTKKAIAARFGVDAATIRHIQIGRTWRKPPPRQFSAEEIAAIKAKRASQTQRQIASEYGVSHNIIQRILAGKRYVSLRPSRAT